MKNLLFKSDLLTLLNDSSNEDSGNLEEAYEKFVGKLQSLVQDSKNVRVLYFHLQNVKIELEIKLKKKSYS